MDAEEPEDLDLGVSPAEILLAAILAKDYVSNSYTDHKQRLAKHREMALDWIDWAVCESDLGRLLVEARARAAATTRKDDGDRFIGLPPV